MKTRACSPEQDLGLGGLYDFLPPPDPEKDKAHGQIVRHVLFSIRKLMNPDSEMVQFGSMMFLNRIGMKLECG
jgi:hypothetical protein